ncbi:MAG: hypothetical protein KJO53_10440 [Eudoraea sp.]|nr:hypothetical protein [Eudoraea sp.]
MKFKTILIIALVTILTPLIGKATPLHLSKTANFNIDKDLLLVQYDCKTDVDDLHSVAAFITLMSHSNFKKVNYHAVAGTYGIQEGLYVPPNDLFKLAFGDNWTDAHKNLESAVARVKELAKKTLANKGDIWIADAGQSDFSAELVKALQADLPELNISQRIHVVQHSDWNEEVTSPASLDFVKKNTTYHKIPDGNAVGNGTPGFRTPDYTNWKDKIKDPKLVSIWQLAIDLGNKYNGKEGRYNNEAIAAGGLDFSDLSEVCWILGIAYIKDTAQFFSLYSN